MKISQSLWMGTWSLIRPKKRNAMRGSGGITVVVKEKLISDNVVKRIYKNLSVCVVLLLDGSKFEILFSLHM